MNMKKILVLVAILGSPAMANAVPMTWSFSGVCGSGNCATYPSVSGTLSGDPSALLNPGELYEGLFLGEVSSFSFLVGSTTFSGGSLNAFGSYTLDPSGNIISGSMSFGEFALNFTGGTGSWSVNQSCGFFGLSQCQRAGGAGGYSKVPEPGSLALLGLGLVALGFSRRRRTAI